MSVRVCVTISWSSASVRSYSLREIILAECDDEDDCSDSLEAVDPLLALGPLSANVEHSGTNYSAISSTSERMGVGIRSGQWRRYTRARQVDPSAAPPSVFRLARTKSGWRAGAPTKIRLTAAPNFSGGGGGGGGGGIRRQFVSVHIKGQIK